MYTIPIKRWFHRVHMPRGHELILRINSLAHNPLFWGIVALAVFMTLLITLAVLAARSGASPTDQMPARPFFPY